MNIVHYAIGFGSENVLVRHTFIVIGLWLFSFCEFDVFAWSPWPVISKCNKGSLLGMIEF